VRRLLHVLVLLVLLVSASGTARADRSRQTAQILSGAGTGVSSAVILAGFVFASQGNPFNKPLMYTGLASAALTPSLGEIYAGDYVTIGMAVRVAAAGLATYALVNKTETKTCDDAMMSSQQCTNLSGPGIAILGVAAIAFIGGMAYDVGDAGPAVDRYNRSHGVMIAPTALATPTGPAPGLALAGAF
jgi:hypothetical protein